MADIIQKTKDTNTFRFKSFGERVNEIDIRRLALYHIGHGNEELPEDNETFFHQTLNKWLVLNLTEEYNSFSRKCLKIVTLPQLIHSKDFVVDLLLERLATATNLSLQPLLELLYVLARDLREEFYPYFQRVLDRLICLLNTQDAEQLEWTLVCLAYLFKALKPYLKKNIGVVFHAILPLLDEQRYEEHVTNFAVECFSFIARDVRDYGKFLDFILETVAHEQVESINGCGRLLYEIVRGVKGQFHSVAADFLRFICERLVTVSAKSTLLCDIVRVSVQDLLRSIHPQNISLFWQQLCAVALQATQNPRQLKNLHHLIAVMLQLANHKDGRYLAELDVLVPCILKMYDASVQAQIDTSLQLLCQLVAQILLCGSAQLTQLDTSRLLKKLLTLPQRTHYDAFVLAIAHHPQFELLVLPTVSSYFERHYDLPAYELMAQLVLQKRPLAKNGAGLAAWQPYTLQMKQPATLTRMLDNLKQFDVHNEEELESCLLQLILAPHVAGLQTNALQSTLQKANNDLLSDLANGKQLERTLNILGLLLELQIQMQLLMSSAQLIEMITALLPYAGAHMHALQAVDQLLCQQKKRWTVEQLEVFSEHLSPLLSASQHEVRQLAAHCLLSLHAKSSQSSKLYEVFYAAASIEPDVHNYREQLLLLQQLHTAGELYRTHSDAQQQQHTLRFLLGMWQQNFKFVWSSVQQLIEEYARVMDVDQFWNIYKAQLSQVASAKNYLNEEKIQNLEPYWRSDALQQLLPLEVKVLPTQGQLQIYRNALWSRLPSYGVLVERKNRELMTMFMQFVDREYRQQLEQREYTWNLCEKQENEGELDEVLQEQATQSDEDDGEDKDEQQHVPKQRKRQHKAGKTNNVSKQILQALQAHMSWLTVQPNPKALYGERELYAFYMDLLATGQSQLQKLALDCVYTYKTKSLLPYKEQLYALQDEQQFKQALLNFNMENITTEQREPLMHILLRLLYGKMLMRGIERQRATQARKALILRFLGQCEQSEIAWFLQMAFDRYAEYVSESLSIEQLPNYVRDNFKLNAVWSPKKLQNIVNLLELMRKEFGGLLSNELLLYMLKLLTFVGATCNAVLDAQPAVPNKIQIIYRQLRNAALSSVVNFFGHFTKFPWETAHLKSLSEVYVWPVVARLPQECIHTPTPLLKLLLQWGMQPGHFEYLLQQQENDKINEEEPTIFHYVMQLLLQPQAKPAVRKPILMLVERLLLTVSEGAKEADRAYAEVALKLIKPHINEILQRLQLSLTTRRGAHKPSLDKLELHILSLLTVHVEQPESCEQLLQLILPILLTKVSSTSTTSSPLDEEQLCQYVNTLAQLLKRLPTPEKYLPQLAPLYAYVQPVAVRKLLCQLLTAMAKQRKTENESLREMSQLVQLLNAWDKRWLEQPDYDKRLEALRVMRDKLSNGSVELNLGVLVFYNCCYYLRCEKDLGLRDNASELLQNLLPHLVRKCEGDRKQLDYLVGEVFLPMLRRLMFDANVGNASSGAARHEGTRLLGVLARECAEAHVVLGDLHALGDAQDDELDFFENLIHLQTHRHGRALLRFCSHAATLRQPPTIRTLTQFVLPLASRYLLQAQYVGKHTLIDAAIEALGVVCQLLPWTQYHAVLRYYLGKLRTAHEHQRQCVRIVVRILDAYHFELTIAETVGVEVEQLKVTLKEQAEIAREEDKKEEDTAVEVKPENEEDNLSEALESDSNGDDNDDNDVEVDNGKQVENEKLPYMKRSMLLPANASKRVLHTITTVLIPTLNRAITEQSSYDGKHKVNRKRFSAEREEEEILRVPIALALVKLMQKLPKELLDTSLPGVFMKVCTFLRSPLKSVRMLTRDILKKIMLTLGSKYLSMLMEHLQSLLTRGFQVHVLAVTVHGVLDALREHIQPGDIESCLGNLLDVALNDIFGELNAQKELNKFTAHTPEAKPSAKSYLVLHIAARNIQESCLLDLLLPFKEHLARSHARKMTLKIQECFAKIVSGLVENPHISRESLLIFIYGTTSESISELLPGTEKRVLSEQEKERMRRARPDALLIQPAPRTRAGATNKPVKSNVQANAHILVEFGLELLHIVLKRKKLMVNGTENYDYQPFLNPLLPLLRDALQSNHVRVTTFALKCFASIWQEEYDLPALQEHLPAVVKRLYELLQNLSTFGAVKQEENQQLMKAAYKAIVALLRKCESYHPTEEQTEQLLLLIEHQLLEDVQQSIAFNLLKALLLRRVDTRALHDVMKRIGELSVVSPVDYVRDEARNLMFTYLMEYQLKRGVIQIIKFFTVQLSYALPTGRQSAIKLFNLIIKKFPTVALAKRAELMYLSLGARLVNDDNVECRQAVAECLELLIARLEKPDRQELFDMTLVLFNAKHKPSVREMAAALCSRFLNAEKQGFAGRLDKLLPSLLARMTLGKVNAPGRFVRAPGAMEMKMQHQREKRMKLNKSRNDRMHMENVLGTEENENEVAEFEQRALDHELIQMQYCLLKVFEYCSEELFTNAALSHTLDELAYESQRLLAHEHSWVRCNAAKVLAHILANYDYARVGRKLCNVKEEVEVEAEADDESNAKYNLDFIYLNPAYDIKSLVLDLCAQMVAGETPQPMIDEMVKIFLYVANMLRDVPCSVKVEKITKHEDEAETLANGDDEVGATKINLNWLLRNVRFLINKEVAKAPHCISMRSALFTLLEGLITLLSVSTLETLAPTLLAILVREMSEDDQHVDSELRQQALRVGSRLRKRIGSDAYDKYRTAAQQKLMVRRAERKKTIAQEKIHDPVRAAKRKVGVQDRKKAAKKRKVAVIRGKAADVKQIMKKRKRKAEDVF